MTYSTKRIGLAFALIYISGVCAWTWDDGFTEQNSTVFDAWVIFSVALCFTYGVLSIHRDFVLFGWRWIIRSFDRSLGVSDFIKDVKKLIDKK